MTLRLRAHHLLCMLTYVGKGYTPAFVVNYDRIVGQLNAGAPFLLIEGPDDICQPMLGETSCHCHNPSVVERDRIAHDALCALVPKLKGSGCCVQLTAGDLEILREAFANGSLRRACEGCEWHALCSRVATNSFRGCRLQLTPDQNLEDPVTGGG